jgi:hypothetical protein
LKYDEDFKPILDRFDKTMRKYPDAKKDYDMKLKQWQDAVKKAKTEGKKPPRKPQEPCFENTRFQQDFDFACQSFFGLLP